MSPDDKLRRIALAFNKETGNADGSITMTHAYYNLEGAILDIERTGECDDVCMQTVKRVRSQLGEIGKILKSE